MIIGLTGPNAAGKGAVADILREHGHAYFSLSDEIREEAKKRSLEPTRENLIRIGNEMRKLHGDGVWAEQLCKKALPEKTIVDSIRHPDEATELKKRDNFILIKVDAPIELRFKRAIARNRAGDATTLEDFKEKEMREMTAGKNVQQLGKVMNLANLTIINDGNLEQLRDKVESLLNKF